MVLKSNFRIFQISLSLLVIFHINCVCFSQLILTESPENYQLYGRNKETNTALIKIKGKYVKNETQLFENHFLKFVFYRGNSIISEQYIHLDTFMLHDEAQIDLQFTINAELINYRLEVEEHKPNLSPIILEKFTHLVCGDAFIIQGQSNAEAKKRGESANAHQNEFIRVFGGGFVDTGAYFQHLNWKIGQGDGSFNTDANCGQWGLYLADQLVKTTDIPIAVFNGAQGGQKINFFRRYQNYESTFSSNYTRLLYRVKKSNLQNNIRFLAWSQGERDAFKGNCTSKEVYKEHLLKLVENWKENFTSLEKIYFFQTAKGCQTDELCLQKITDSQYEIAKDDPFIHIIPTHGIQNFSDNCHYTFDEGYKVFGQRIFNFVINDIYNFSLKKEYSSFVSAGIFNDEFLVLESDNELSANSNFFDYFIINDEKLVKPEVYDIKNKYLFLKFEYDVSSIEKISYYGSLENKSSLRDKNNLELIKNTILVSNSPITFDDISNEQIVLLPQIGIFLTLKDLEFLEITNMQGQTIHFDKKIQMASKMIFIDFEKLPKGIYFYRTQNVIGKFQVI